MKMISTIEDVMESLSVHVIGSVYIAMTYTVTLHYANIPIDSHSKTTNTHVCI